MATQGPTQLPAFFNGDADFQTWAQGIHNALIACGLVQTADTGQINFATVTRPVNEATTGYAIYRFSDALQATKPVFVKIEYGTSNQSDRPGVWVTVGSTTNGAGVLGGGGMVSNRAHIGASASKVAAATLPMYASGDGSRISLAFNIDGASNGFGNIVHVERTRDTTGAYTGDGVLFALNGARSATNNNGTQPIPFNGGVPPANGPGPALPVAAAGNKSVVGADVGVGCGVYFLGKPFYCLLGAVNPSDIAFAATFVASVFGANHTFLAAGPIGGMSGFIYGSPGGHCVAIPWE